MAVAARRILFGHAPWLYVCVGKANTEDSRVAVCVTEEIVLRRLCRFELTKLGSYISWSSEVNYGDLSS